MKLIFRWLIGLFLGTYLVLTIALMLPFVQHWLGDKISAFASDYLGTELSIGRIQLGLNGRLILDDIHLKDQSHAELISAKRAAAKFNLWDIIQKRIHLGNIQLFCPQVTIYKERPEEAFNYQFLIDKLSSKDSKESTPLDLQIGQAVIRRGELFFDLRWQSTLEGRFSPNHVHVSDFNLTAQINTLTNDSIDVELKRLDFKEASGWVVNTMTTSIQGTLPHLCINDLKLALPHSNLHVPTASVTFNNDKTKLGYLSLEAKGAISPNDLTPISNFRITDDRPIAFNCEVEGSLNALDVHSLSINDPYKQLFLQASGHVNNLQENKQRITAEATIQRLFVTSELATIYKQIDILDRLEFADISGQVTYAGQNFITDLDIVTKLGNAQVEGKIDTKGATDASISSPQFELGKLIGGKAEQLLGALAMEAQLQGKFPNDLKLNASLPFIEYNKYKFSNIALSGTAKGSEYAGNLTVNDENVNLTLSGTANSNKKQADLQANIVSFRPNALHLTKMYPNTCFSGNVTASVQGTSLEDFAGDIHIDDLCITDSLGDYKPGDIHITSAPREAGDKHLVFISPFLESQVDGHFSYSALKAEIINVASNYLPTLVTPSNQELSTSDYGKIDFKLFSAEPLSRLLGIPLTITQPVIAHGEIDTDSRVLMLTASAPFVQYKNETLRNIDLRVESNQQSLLSTLQLARKMKNRFVDLGMETTSNNGSLNTRLFWNANPSYMGDISLVTSFPRDEHNRPGVKAQLQNSNFMLADTLWTVHPGALSFADGRLQVDSLLITSGNRLLGVNGTASSEPTDTLHAQLRDINLDYIFQMVNFHAVEFSGNATGHAYATNLFQKPNVDAYIQVPNFTLNGGNLGNLSLYGNWGGKRPYSIYLDGIINDSYDPQTTRTTLVNGFITPKKGVDYHGLDLNIHADHTNLFFLNKFTAAIFDNLQGRASGWTRIFGPFKSINLEGDVMVNEAQVGIPFTNVRYHLANDSVHMRPGRIYFADATIYDPQGNANIPDHQAKVSGRLTHDHFSNLGYDIAMRGTNILGYDFREMSDLPFYGTVFASGDVHIYGHPGTCTIDIKAQPQRNTSVTYNITSPDKLTESQFLTFIDRQEAAAQETDETPSATPLPLSDLRINFNLDIDNRATMNLLTDARSGDRISVAGHGNMLAHYYNKGNFQLYGTYHVERGTYNLSLQEIVHKNFDFQNGGTLTFAGNPMDGDVHLQATHTVNGVSLNDLSARANFSNNKARVKCLMNVSGKARQPHIAFDFDILNVNEDEKQMVRSLISTEEERNMQVIYLLGIGRFYTYEYAGDPQTQSYTAMNSLLSSTLSGQINQMLSNVVRNQNWNFGAHLSTGEMGWNDMDIEGMLQGSLLNNRLLLNGQFGYRDNAALQGNFIGDFEARYLLTRNGGVSLKAYSETNDRYFTKTALTTQGIGILLKKDFSSWKDFFKRK
ncbi:MAG: translocation/assembly module TamB domain-containing protein [Bacteroidaceae bacterium]|nr:translocation/assembly module TamB domain-containing protein [Bacteroidaceae bacterium]